MNFETIMLIAAVTAFSLFFTYVVYQATRRMMDDMIERISTVNNRIDSVDRDNEHKLEQKFEDVYRSIDSMYRETEKCSNRQALIQEIENCTDKKNIRAIVEKYI